MGISVPRVWDQVDADGAQAFVMEKIFEGSMMDQVARNPFSTGSVAKELARLHHAPSEIKAVESGKNQADLFLEI